MDFSHHHHLSESDEDSAVEDLLSQAKDHVLLEQLASINCSSFTDDSVLPTHLESRFSKLKSFPAITAATTTASFRRNSLSPQNPDELRAPLPKAQQSGNVSPPLKSPEFSPEKVVSSSKASKPKPKHGSLSSASNSSNSSPESATFSPAKRVSGKKQRSKSKSKSGWLSSPLGSCNSLREDSPSPPRKAGCFWCSPKRNIASSQRRSKENGGVGGGIGLDFSDDSELLSGLGSFSKKEQSKILKKAMKEEEKISREAEKIVKWAKQESARMNVTGIDDELSD